MLLFHLNKSHEIKRSSPSDISKLIVKLCITTRINGANYLSGSQKLVTGSLVQKKFTSTLSDCSIQKRLTDRARGLLFMSLTHYITKARFSV